MKSASLLLCASAASPIVTASGSLDGLVRSYTQFRTLPAPQRTCESLKAQFPTFVSLPGSPDYVQQNNDFWSSASAKNPACIFAPNKDEDLGTVIKFLRIAKTPFAIRGGGHMPIGDYNNIDSRGVLLSGLNFKQLGYTADKATVNVGPNNRWQDVYKLLSADGLLVVGGRVGVVGIPGFFLGGGVSYLGNQYGWAANNLVSLTGVLADGRVVKATANNQYSDLFWALKGGGNSFLLLTNLELKTYAAPVTHAGSMTYGTGNEVKDKWFNAIVSNALYGNQDPKHGLVPLAVRGTPIPFPTPLYAADLFYNGDNAAPAVFANFTAPVFAPALGGSVTRKTLFDFATERPAAPPGSPAQRQRFYFMSIPADVGALRIVHDAYFTKVESTLAGKFPYFLASFAAMPMPTSFFSNAAARGGDPMGIKASDGPQIWLEFSIGHLNPSEDATMDKFLTELDTDVKKQLADNKTPANKFIYLNDADRFQKPFAGYAAGSVQRLKSIRAKYDPTKLFTNQLPGGFKVDSA